MTEATGLGPVELAVLDSIESLTADGRHARTDRVLDDLERRHHVGARYAVTVVQDLGVAWRTLVHLVDLEGNWGYGVSDEMADPQYTEVRLSDVGRLALAAERGDVGPVPVGLLNGTVYRGGRVPSLDPVPTLDLLASLVAGGGLPAGLTGLVRLPTAGVVTDGLAAVVAGVPTRVTVSCRIERHDVRGQRALVVTGTPLGHDTYEIEQFIHQRLHDERSPRRRRYREQDDFMEDALPDPEPGALGVDDVRDESSDLQGTRLVVTLRPDVDAGVVEAWLRSIWPVSVVEDWHVPGGLAALVESWADRCSRDPSGLRALREAVG